MIVDRIILHATDQAKDRPLPRVAAWSVGRCVRQQWYMHHNVVGEPLPARTMLRFELGDLIETAVCQRIEATDIDFLRTDQRKLDNLTVPELGFRCRSDFVFSCPEDLSLSTKIALEIGEMAMTAYDGTPPARGDICGGEIKSMTDFAYERAQKGILDESYLAQVECGLRALDCRWWCLIAYRAETSHLCEIWICRNDARWQAIKVAVAIIRGDTCPDRPYRLDAECSGVRTGACVGGRTPGRGQPHKNCGGTGQEPGGPFVPNFPCGYCPYKAHCWRDAGALELTFKDGKPRWRVT